MSSKRKGEIQTQGKNESFGTGARDSRGPAQGQHTPPSADRPSSPFWWLWRLRTLIWHPSLRFYIQEQTAHSSFAFPSTSFLMEQKGWPADSDTCIFWPESLSFSAMHGRCGFAPCELVSGVHTLATVSRRIKLIFWTGKAEDQGNASPAEKENH